MAVSSNPIRLDADLVQAAARVAASMSRSTAQQIAHWARIGRELEMMPGTSLARIEDVLEGRVDYDSLGREEQAAVRAERSARIEERRRALRMDKVLAAEGKTYAELDETGRVVIRTPARAAKTPASPEIEKAATRTKAKRRKRETATGGARQGKPKTKAGGGVPKGRKAAKR